MRRVILYCVASICFFVLCMTTSACDGKFLNEETAQDYLKKLWIVSDLEDTFAQAKERSEIFRPSSFYLTKLQNGLLKGAFQDSYSDIPGGPVVGYSRFKPAQNLNGVIIGDIALCTFDNPYEKVFVSPSGRVNDTFYFTNGFEGTVNFRFMSPSEIEAEVNYTKKGDYLEDYKYNGTFLYRPYVVADIENADPSRTYYYPVELDPWGNVNVMTTVILGNKPYPEAYIVNNSGEVLYDFPYGFLVGTEIGEVYFEYINDDELLDVRIIAYAAGSVSDLSYFFEYTFMQLDEYGWFGKPDLEIHEKEHNTNP